MIGYDKVDISKASLPLAVRCQIEFIRGNFQPETTTPHLRLNKNVMPHTLRTHRLMGTRIRRNLSRTRPRRTTGVDRRYHHLPTPTPHHPSSQLRIPLRRSAFQDIRHLPPSQDVHLATDERYIWIRGAGASHASFPCSSRSHTH